MSKFLFAFVFVLLAALVAAQPSFVPGSQTICQSNPKQPNANIAFNSTNGVKSVQSLNTSVVPNTALNFTNSSASQFNLFVAPTGYGFVQINVTDNAGLSTLFNLTVTRADIAPQVLFANTTFPDQCTYPTVLSVASFSPVEAGQTLVSISTTGNSNPSIFLSPPVFDLNGTITFQLVCDFSGFSDVTFTLIDSGSSTCGSNTTTFTVRIFNTISTTPSTTPKLTKTPKPRTPRPNPPPPPPPRTRRPNPPPRPPPPRRSPSPSESGSVVLRPVFSAFF